MALLRTGSYSASKVKQHCGTRQHVDTTAGPVWEAIPTHPADFVGTASTREREDVFLPVVGGVLNLD